MSLVTGLVGAGVVNNGPEESIEINIKSDHHYLMVEVQL